MRILRDRDEGICLRSQRYEVVELEFEPEQAGNVACCKETSVALRGNRGAKWCERDWLREDGRPEDQEAVM